MVDSKWANLLSKCLRIQTSLSNEIMDVYVLCFSCLTWLHPVIQEKELQNAMTP